jgi:hypothetical protein
VKANAALLALDPNYNVVLRSNGLDLLLGCGTGRVETHLNTGPFFEFWGKCMLNKSVVPSLASRVRAENPACDQVRCFPSMSLPTSLKMNLQIRQKQKKPNQPNKNNKQTHKTKQKEEKKVKGLV